MPMACLVNVWSRGAVPARVWQRRSQASQERVGGTFDRSGQRQGAVEQARFADPEIAGSGTWRPWRALNRVRAKSSATSGGALLRNAAAAASRASRPTPARACASESGLENARWMKSTASRAPGRSVASAASASSTSSAASRSRASARSTSRHITLPEPSQIALTGASR